jgi:hypothetical protein
MQLLDASLFGAEHLNLCAGVLELIERKGWINSGRDGSRYKARQAPAPGDDPADDIVCTRIRQSHEIPSAGQRFLLRLQVCNAEAVTPLTSRWEHS